MNAGGMRRIATLMPNAQAAIGSRMCMSDDKQWCFQELIGFLKQRA